MIIIRWINLKKQTELTLLFSIYHHLQGIIIKQVNYMSHFILKGHNLLHNSFAVIKNDNTVNTARKMDHLYENR